MNHLGATRSVRRANHALQTPDTFIRTQLPGMIRAAAIVHTSPAMGAAFTQYTAELEAGGSVGECLYQRFLYVLDGLIEITAGAETHSLGNAAYAYLPAGHHHTVTASVSSRIVIIEKRYQEAPDIHPPAAIFANALEIPSQALMGDSDLQVSSLLPTTMAFDFAVNIMTYQPGAALNMVEMHVMEHGLLMLEGGGIYRLDDSWYPVTAGEFIWMGPYCPQWFGALGKTPAKYLIYKDWNRHPLG